MTVPRLGSKGKRWAAERVSVITGLLYRRPSFPPSLFRRPVIPPPTSGGGGTSNSPVYASTARRPPPLSPVYAASKHTTFAANLSTHP